MILLRDILYKSGLIEVTGSTDLEISSVCFDSRKAAPGALFVAVKGTQSDGHLFIDKTIESGAVAFVCEELPAILQLDVVYIKVKDSAIALGYIAANFYDNPSEKLKLIGLNPGRIGANDISRSINIYSPINGFVTAVNVNIGKYVNPSDVLFELVNPTDIHLALTLAR